MLCRSSLPALAACLALSELAFAQRNSEIHFRPSTQFADLAVTERAVPRGGEIRFRIARVGDGRESVSIQVDFAPDGRNINGRLRKQFTNLRLNDYIAFRVAQDSVLVLTDMTGKFDQIRKTDEVTQVQYGTGAIVDFKVYFRGRF